MTEYILAGLSAVGTVIWYLLQSKDAAQAKAIELLFTKHDADYAELQALKLQIANQHYVKHELDNKFDKLEGAFKEGFESLGGKMDMLVKILAERARRGESER